MRVWARLAAILTLLILAPAPAAAIQLLADERFNRRSGTTFDDEGNPVPFEEIQLPETPFGPLPFNSFLDITGDGLTLTWTAQTERSGSTLTTSTALFEIDFLVEGSGFLELSGTIRTEGNGSTLVRIEQGGSTLFSASDFDGFLPVPVDFSTPLAPGEYTLFAEASAGAIPVILPFAEADFDLSFVLSDSVPIPEPSTALLIGSGLSVLALRRGIHRRGSGASPGRNACQ